MNHTTRNDAEGVRGERQTAAAGGYKLPALAILSEISASLATESDLEALLQRFLSTMMRLVGAKGGAVWLLGPDETRLHLIGSLGLPPELLEKERSIPLDCGVCADAALHNSIQFSNQLQSCARRTASSFFGSTCRRIVAVPLQYKGRVLGSYSFFLPEDRPIPDEVALLFRSISEHLGIALENARLTRENMRIALMNERQMLAAEVHDSLAQTLAYMKMRMPVLREAVAGGDEALSFHYIAELGEALESAYASVRDLLSQFRNRMDPKGLLHALQIMADAFPRRTGIAIEFRNNSGDFDLTPEQEVQAFHIVQEALANVAKHSRARKVRLSLFHDGGQYVIAVEDDGVGIAATDNGGGGAHYDHFGMSIMRERAEKLGGTLAVESAGSRGTRLRLVFPAAAPNRLAR